MGTNSVSTFQVASYFVQQYYRTLQESPEYAHQFYSDSSTVTRMDGDMEDTTASSILEIHSLLTSLKYTAIEISKLKGQESWNGGILIMVSGYVKSRNFTGRRKFSQVFFLAPQETGFFVHNDYFEYTEEEHVDQKNAVPEVRGIHVDSEAQSSYYHEQPESDFDVEEEPSEYISSIRIEEGNPVDKYNLVDEQQNEEPEVEHVIEEAPVDEPPLYESQVNVGQENTSAPVNEPVGESSRLTYASILRASKGVEPSLPVTRQSMPQPEQKAHVQMAPSQVHPSASSVVPEAAGAKAEEASTPEEDVLTSVYVRNLPSNVTAADLEKEFRNFGQIKPSGIFIRNRKDIGVCFGFVEFEDLASVHIATQASPILVLGKQVFIEERRAGAGRFPRGGGGVGRGRGRGGRGTYPSEPRGYGVSRGTGSRGNGYH